MLVYAIVVIASLSLPTVTGHGYMIDPPSRASRWREDNTDLKYYNDNELFCGGRNVQWIQHEGKCGACGDEYGIPYPKFTYPGKFATNPPITRTYTEGDVIQAKVKITTNHKGDFVFKLARLTSPPIRQDQLDTMVLKLPTGDSKWNLLPGNRVFTISLQLPKGFTCEHCVMQWWYSTRNNWMNTRPESFVNCADVAIVARGSRPRPTVRPSPSSPRPTRPRPTRPRPTRPEPTRPRPTRPQPGGKVCSSLNSSSSMDRWCFDNCRQGYCPASMCKCV